MTNSSDLAYEAIIAAFANVPPPTHSIGQYGDAAFLPRPAAPVHSVSGWQDLSSNLIVRGHVGSLIALITNIFEPADWRYYLPAFMLASLETSSDAKRIRPSTILSLYPHRPDPQTFAARVEGLNQDQRKAVLQFLEAMLEDPDTWIGSSARAQNEAALDYWRTAQQGLKVIKAG